MLEQIRNNKREAIQILCAVLMTILLVLQSMPFWQYGESCSIGSCVWFPGDCKALEA